MKSLSIKIALLLVAGFLLNAPIVHAQSKTDYLEKGNDLYRHGNFDAAIFEYTKALTIDPNYAKAYNNRGVAYAKESSLKRAISDFTMCIAISPRDAQAYNNRGHSYARQGNLLQALSDYNKAIEIDPKYLNAYNNRSQVYYLMGKYDKAWVGVHKVESLGGFVDQYFIKELKEVSPGSP